MPSADPTLGRALLSVPHKEVDVRLLPRLYPCTMCHTSAPQAANGVQVQFSLHASRTTQAFCRGGQAEVGCLLDVNCNDRRTLAPPSRCVGVKGSASTCRPDACIGVCC